MSETEDITKLTNLLHQNGDKVLNALSKLSLNVTLLQQINKNFELFLENDNDNETNKFKVLSSSSSGSQIIQDLHFLHDFMQKTIGLKITNNTNLSLSESKVDISKFKSIKYLEIKKVPVKELTGLKIVQPQLESVVCTKCLSKLEDLLAQCGGDNSVGFVWSELKEAVINYNNIKVLDTSIAFAPWLQILDLSHNKINNVKAIECLPNLEYINLSFNCLSAIPTFSKSSRRKLKVLVINNNYIEDLTGLEGLDHLTELDLSWNWVSDYESLRPLITMSTLQNLSLNRNPISYDKNYKKQVIGYLHINASFADFVLDGSKLSKFEKSIVGYKICQPIRSTSISNVEPVSITAPAAQSPDSEQIVDVKVSSAKKGGKVRLAAIPNLNDGTYEEAPAEISILKVEEFFSTEHLLAKKKIEDTRAAYGSDNWLRCEAGSVVQDILGLPPNDNLSSTPVDFQCLEVALKSEDNIVKTKAIIESHLEPPEIKHDKTNNDSSFTTCIDDISSNYFSIDTTNNAEESSDEKYKEVNVGSKEASPEFEAIQVSCEEIEDENDKVFLVSKIMESGNGEVQSEELFLTLTDEELKEKDSNLGRVITKWSISSLESCVKLNANKLHLNFDTLKRDKRERIYELEAEEALILYKILTEILESRMLRDMNQIVNKCITCSSEFSTLRNKRKREPNPPCPFCNSKLIIEVNDDSPTDQEKSFKVKPSRVKNSDNKSSQVKSPVGPAQALPNQPSDKLVNCSSNSSIDYTASHSAKVPKSSATSLEESNEFPSNQNKSAKRSYSDIEILSNPSQSSIEVIDGSSRIYGGNTPNRRSSEERQVIQSSAIPADIKSQSLGIRLTESSSSGSVTDSVCTAYENSSGTSAVGLRDNVNVAVEQAQEIISKSKGEKEMEPVIKNEGVTENKNESLYQSRNKTAQRVCEMQYSYTDFTKIDHRIKLFLYSQIFEDNSEEFCFGLRCTVLGKSAVSFESFIVFSNKKLYILKIIGPEEGYDASNFLKKSNSLKFNIKTVKSVGVLPWSQGFCLKLQDSYDKIKEFLLLLKDRKRTQNFLNFLQSEAAGLPASCNVISEFSQKPILAMEHLLVSGASEDTNIQYFSLGCSCSVTRYGPSKEMQSVSILTNSTDLLLFSCEPTWFFDGVDQPPEPVFRQKISNLMKAEIKSRRICLQFLMNECEEKEEIWDITLETEEAVQDLINSVKSPWEELFLVPISIVYS